mgnify:CR=1 FL=1
MMMRLMSNPEREEAARSNSWSIDDRSKVIVIFGLDWSLPEWLSLSKLQLLTPYVELQ